MQDELAGLFWRPGPERPWNQPEFERAVSDGVGRALGGSGIFGLLILGSATAGLWILWQLIQSGTELLAQTIIEGEMLPARPDLAAHVDSRPWLRLVTEMTVMHFAALAVSGMVFAATVSCLLPR